VGTRIVTCFSTLLSSTQQRIHIVIVVSGSCTKRVKKPGGPGEHTT
jgi:hypothetical protein